jgi:Outer membrane protein beta-barrel domain
LRVIKTPAIGLSTVLVAGAAFAQAPGAAPPPAQPAAQPAQQPETTAESGGAGAPVTPGLSAALLLGYGMTFDLPYNVGLGARVGYTLPMNLYVGGTFVYHLGESKDYPDHSTKMNVWYVAGEVGYSLAEAPLVIRPYGGIGMARASRDVTGRDVTGLGSQSLTRLVFWPGVTALFRIGNAFVGADMRYVVMTNVSDRSSGNSLGMFLTVGMR